MTILDNIDTILAELKMSRSALEKKAGIGRQSVEKWDKSIPRLDMILRVAEVLGVPLSRLLEGTELQSVSKHFRLFGCKDFFPSVNGFFLFICKI